MINGGDMLAVSISDPPQGFTTTIRDLTTHQTGIMTASAANGFMNTNIADCSGTPFTFHAEYSTAKQQNQVPWAALEGGVLMQQEIGHSEVCNSVTNQDPFTFLPPAARRYSDPNVFDTCVGGSEGPTPTGEGPCDAARHLPERDDPGTERAGGVSDQRLQQRRELRVRRRLVLPEGHRHGHGQRRAGDGVLGRQPVLRQPVPER